MAICIGKQAAASTVKKGFQETHHHANCDRNGNELSNPRTMKMVTSIAWKKNEKEGRKPEGAKSRTKVCWVCEKSSKTKVGSQKEQENHGRRFLWFARNLGKGTTPNSTLQKAKHE